MIGCKSTLYCLLEKIDATDEEREIRLCNLEKAIPAWVLLPKIYVRLVVAKHVEAMIREGFIKKWALATDAESLANLVAHVSSGENYLNGGVPYTLASVDHPGRGDGGVV